MGNFVKSYRGKVIDMDEIARKMDTKIALGNAHFNGRGDLIGRGGKIIKSREDQLKDYSESHKIVSTDAVMMSDSDNSITNDELENALPINIQTILKRGRKPKEEIIEENTTDFIPDEENK